MTAADRVIRRTTYAVWPKGPCGTMAAANTAQIVEESCVDAHLGATRSAGAGAGSLTAAWCSGGTNLGGISRHGEHLADLANLLAQAELGAARDTEQAYKMNTTVRQSEPTAYRSQTAYRSCKGRRSWAASPCCWSNNRGAPGKCSMY